MPLVGPNLEAYYSPVMQIVLHTVIDPTKPSISVIQEGAFTYADGEEVKVFPAYLTPESSARFMTLLFAALATNSSARNIRLFPIEYGESARIDGPRLRFETGTREEGSYKTVTNSLAMLLYNIESVVAKQSAALELKQGHGVSKEQENEMISRYLHDSWLPVLVSDFRQAEAQGVLPVSE